MKKNNEAVKVKEQKSPLQTFQGNVNFFGTGQYSQE